MGVGWNVLGDCVWEGEKDGAWLKQCWDILTMLTLLSSPLMVGILCLHQVIALQGYDIQQQKIVKQS